MNRDRRRISASLALATCLPAAAVHAQNLTDRPIQIVVPFTAGGNVDVVARTIAQGLAERLKANVVVENKAGANAMIGAEFVSRAPADGHTLLFATAETHAINPHVYRKLPYDPRTDFTSIGIVSRFPFALVVSPSIPSGSLKEFVEYARRNPGKLNYASWGVGSTSQIAFEQLKQATGIEAVHVPFKGAAPAITAVAAGDVQAFMVPLSVALPQAASGRVRIVAVTSGQREASAPQIPTAREQGVAVTIGGWHVLAAPKGTPASVIAQLSEALNAVTGDPVYVQKLRSQGVEAVRSTPQAAQAMVMDEYRHWGEVARAAAIKAD